MVVRHSNLNGVYIMQPLPTSETKLSTSSFPSFPTVSHCRFACFTDTSSTIPLPYSKPAICRFDDVKIFTAQPSELVSLWVMA